MEEGFRLKKFLNKTTQQLLKNSKDHISYKTNMMKGLLEQVNMARGWSEEFGYPANGLKMIIEGPKLG